jgi:uncharacterized protein
MLFAVLFVDDASRANTRTAHMRKHLAFLERNANAIKTAGPLTDAEDGGPADGLWLVEAESIENVRALLQAAPFWPTGLRKSIRALRWNQVSPVAGEARFRSSTSVLNMCLRHADLVPVGWRR